MWFAARLILRSVHVGAHDPLIFQELTPDELDADTYEETIVLIQADDEEQALLQATELGKSKEHSYQNRYGQTVEWKLTKVADVKEILEDSIGHGTEVYYRFLSRRKGDTAEIE